MKHILTGVAATALLLACGDDGRPAKSPGVPPAEVGGTDTSPVPVQDTEVTRGVPSPPGLPDTMPAPTGVRPAATDTASGQPLSVPPPARPPDTIGTRRPMPPRTPPTVVPDAGPPTPPGEAAQVVPAGRELPVALADSKPR